MALSTFSVKPMTAFLPQFTWLRTMTGFSRAIVDAHGDLVSDFTVVFAADVDECNADLLGLDMWASGALDQESYVRYGH
jgi:hypothetical protein